MDEEMSDEDLINALPVEDLQDLYDLEREVIKFCKLDNEPLTMKI